MENQFERYTVTAALPYANGPVHIGHLAGVYVPADIYVRYKRLLKEDVVFVCGSDEHGVAINMKARKEGISPQEVVNKYHQMIKQSFEQFGISFDIYSRTTDQIHHETSREIFRKLYDKGEFVEKSTSQFFDEEAGQFLADRYIMGECPVCGNPDAYGDQCEKCGSSLTPTELKNPRSMLSGSSPVLRETKHWFLPLDKYEPWLREYILQNHKEWKPNVYGQCKSWLDNGLQPRPMTRDLDWGIKVPVEDAEGKVLYVWFDAPIGYISATKQWAKKANKDWELYWKDENTRLLHFIGKDNIVFHCIIFPAILKATGEYIVPDNVPANEFLNLEDNKISTSRNWAVWLHEFLQDMPGREDALRYALTANMPEAKDNDFTWLDFQARNNSELVAILGNFVNRAIVLTHKYFDGKLPALGQLTEADNDLYMQVLEMPQHIADSLEKFRFREAMAHFIDLARIGNKYLADQEPWKLIKTDEERTGTILHIALQIAANISIVGEPFLPFTMKKLSSTFGIKEMEWKAAGKMDILKSGQEITNPGLLFTKVDDAEIEKQLNKLKKEDTMEPQDDKNIEPPKELIEFDDFLKLDLRVGKILEAAKVPKSSKLLQFTVDMGFEKRTILSGIAKFYNPEEMIGRNVTVIVNLKPRSIMGIESKGMILMAESSDKKLHILNPGENANPGDSIS